MSDPFKPWKEKTRWEKLRYGSIVGVVDSYDVPDSRLTENVEFHSEFWTTTHCRWRWCYNEGLHWFRSDTKPNKEQIEIIRYHLTKNTVSNGRKTAIMIGSIF